MRQFNLCLGRCCLGAQGEDVKDELRAVDDAHLQSGLDVTDLLGGEFIVEDDDVDLFGLVILLTGGDESAYFVQLSLSEVGDAAGPVGALRETAHSACAGGSGEEL